MAVEEDPCRRVLRSAANLSGEDGHSPAFIYFLRASLLIQSFEVSITTTARPTTSSTGVSDSKKGATRRRKTDQQDVLSIRKPSLGEKMPATSASTTYNPQWAIYALLSGAFAAFNGVFAKLTSSPTTSSTITPYLSTILPFLSPDILSLLIRGVFFLLNLLSNAVMWMLFTKALTQHPSSTKVSIVNTSFNFGITAVLGWAVFSEKFGGVLGACGLGCLAVGCVILGSGKDEQAKSTSPGEQTELNGLGHETTDESYRDDADGQAGDLEGKDELDFTLEDEDGGSTTR